MKILIIYRLDHGLTVTFRGFFSLAYRGTRATNLIVGLYLATALFILKYWHFSTHLLSRIIGDKYLHVLDISVFGYCSFEAPEFLNLFGAS